ncbi:hypothetical protein LO80_03460 [Candidatus Francisella endociliophora]|uniref:Uncharacterized protein n=1 Tax=Candidatus Francisella endociliophora TaxID=653937 RepID=A0A097ENH3_9GAMM|nr:hypothetical protein [Francisella sp. FSC1006]AIT09116.1 hypothetical protein LO80_03460 [Francisella sp. FSC1006]
MSNILIRAKNIHLALDVGKDKVYEWRKKYKEHFPKPCINETKLILYRRSDIEEFADKLPQLINSSK